jgi:hypothetical protein
MSMTRIQIRAGLVLCAIAASGITASVTSRAGTQKPDKITVRFIKRLSVESLELRDQAGKLRAQMQVDDTGTVSLGMLDKDRNQHAAVMVSATGQAHFALFSKDQSRVSIGISEKGTPTIHLKYADGTSGIAIGLVENAEPGIVIHDAKGKPVISLALNDDGSAGLQTASNNGKPRLVVGQGFPFMKTGVSVFDGDGNARVFTGLNPDDAAFSGVLDDEE